VATVVFAAIAWVSLGHREAVLAWSSLQPGLHWLDESTLKNMFLLGLQVSLLMLLGTVSWMVWALVLMRRERLRRQHPDAHSNASTSSTSQRHVQ
jgi:hypothetical protein